MSSLTSGVEPLHVSAAVNPHFLNVKWAQAWNLILIPFSSAGRLPEAVNTDPYDPRIPPPEKVVPSPLVRNVLPLIPSTRTRVLYPSGPSLSYQNLLFTLIIRSTSF